MATILEDTGRLLPQKMDVKDLVIIEGHTTQISVQRIVGSLRRPCESLSI